jgi:hypothetical protein
MNKLESMIPKDKPTRSRGNVDDSKPVDLKLQYLAELRQLAFHSSAWVRECAETRIKRICDSIEGDLGMTPPVK